MAHNLRKNDKYKQLEKIKPTDNVTVKREDGKKFVIKGKLVETHLDRGFKIVSKKAGVDETAPMKKEAEVAKPTTIVQKVKSAFKKTTTKKK